MHSEQMELHLQHMIERAQMGMQGEEKEIEELLFDEVYTLVYTIYKDKEKTVFLSKGVLEVFAFARECGCGIPPCGEPL